MNLGQLACESLHEETPARAEPSFFEVQLAMLANDDIAQAELITPQELQDSLGADEATDTSMQKINIKLDNYVQKPGSIESEYNWTCLVKNADFISQAESYVDIEQWQMWIDKNTENRLGGKQRVRKTTTANGQSTYEFTLKVRQAQLKDQNYTVSKEYNTNITEEMFKVLKFMYPNGQLKRRYTVPIEGSELKFEVDAYYKEDGKLSDYITIELETASRLETPPALPSGVMLIEDKVLISKLKKEIFSIDHSRDI